MMRVLLATIVVVCMASLAFAQAGTIGVYADNMGMDCMLQSSMPGLVMFYVVHVNTPGATASQFSAPKPSCMLAQWLADTNVFAVTIGNSQIGVSIGYGSCRVSPIHLLTMSYFAMGATPPCCPYPVLADPGATPPGIYVIDCNFQTLVGRGCLSFVNGNITCHCATPVEETNWGKVKSLYVE